MHAVHVQANSPAGGWRCSCPPALCGHWQKKPWRGSSVAGDAEHSIALHFWYVSLELNHHVLNAHAKATLFDKKSSTCFAWHAHKKMTATCSFYVPRDPASTYCAYITCYTTFCLCLLLHSLQGKGLHRHAMCITCTLIILLCKQFRQQVHQICRYALLIADPQAFRHCAQAGL